MVQAVDCVHSAIERHLRNLEIGSPIKLFKKLIDMDYPNVKLALIQMNDTDFKKFSKKSSEFNFKQISYTKCKIKKYEQASYNIKYKFSGTNIEYLVSNILNTAGKFQKKINLNEELSLIPKKPISNEKQKDLKSMMPYLQKIGQDYSNAVLNKN